MNATNHAIVQTLVSPQILTQVLQAQSSHMQFYKTGEYSHIFSDLIQGIIPFIVVAVAGVITDSLMSHLSLGALHKPGESAETLLRAHTASWNLCTLF